MLTIVAAALASSTPSEAATPVQGEVAAAFGIAFPFGESQAGQPIRDETEMVGFFALGGGLRPIPYLYAGMEWSRAPGRMGDQPPGLCAISKEFSDPCTVRRELWSAWLRFHPIPERAWDPWVGLGVAWERLIFSTNIPLTRTTDPNSPPVMSGAHPETALVGWLLRGQLGADYVVGLVRLGAFFDLDAGRYSSRDVEPHPSLPFIDIEIENRAWHYFAGFGFRAALVFPERSTTLPPARVAPDGRTPPEL